MNHVSRDSLVVPVLPAMGRFNTFAAVPPTLNDERERVLDPRVAYQVTSILQGVVARGTGSAARVLNRHVAGKTGTTNDSRDTWFIGYTPDLVVGTYIGFDTPKSLGEKETGGRVAIQAFIKFFQQAGDLIVDKPFRAPPGIREIPINRQSGQPLFAGGEANGKDIINEAFLTGGPIFKPANELAEELKEKETGAPQQPPVPEPAGEGETVDAPAASENGNPNPAPVPAGPNVFTPPPAGTMAPYQRPIDPQGFDPNVAPTTGTGGMY
jgi:penicillin-binding protein 1A